MENAIYLAVSRQEVQRTNMNIIANNVANMNTPGFRGQNLLFSEYISNPKGSFDPLSFVTADKQYQTTDAGPISYTGNTLDIALEGPGFIGIVGPGEEVHFSRAGNFTLDAEGTLVNSAGYPVADDGGDRIEIPEDATNIKIDETGRIYDGDEEIAQIMVREFENVQAMEPVGNTLYKIDDEGEEAERTVVRQAHLEGSNVLPVIEMTRMIENMRDHQSVQKLLQGENERLRNAIQTLTGGGR